MNPGTNSDGNSPPLFVVFAGVPGAGKTTAIDQVRLEAGFPSLLVIDLPDRREESGKAVSRAIALNESIAIETGLDHAGVVTWMQKAVERGFDVELVVVGVEDDDLLEGRSRGRKLRRQALAAHQRYLSASVDIARRVLLIDNSSAVPFVAGRIEAGAAQVPERRPAWVVSKILAPRLARASSMRTIRKAYDNIASQASLKPLLQVASAGSGTAYVGKVVALSDHHVLQQTGQAMHLIHDLALIANGGAGLALHAIANIVYATAERSIAAIELTQDERDRGRYALEPPGRRLDAPSFLPGARLSGAR